MIDGKYVNKDNPLPDYVLDGGGGGEIADGSITTEKFAPDAKAPLAGEADSANNVVWGNVSEKPASYPTDWDDVSNKPVAYPTKWSDVSGKPTTFPPATHNHDTEYYRKSESDGKYQASGDYVTTSQLTSELEDKLTAVNVDFQAASEAVDIEELVADFNSLLSKLISSGVMKSS